MSTREWRQRVVRMLRVAAGEEDPPGATPKPTTQAQRRRIVEVMCAADGLPPPRWGRGRAEPIDESPWRESRAASVRAMARRFTIHGLAIDGDRRAIYCTRCSEVVLAFPKGRIVAVGTTPSLLAANHRAQGCR